MAGKYKQTAANLSVAHANNYISTNAMFWPDQSKGLAYTPVDSDQVWSQSI